jgi:protein O-GlcNAc transferase
LIRGDEIDILVDLSGHTAYNRTLVLARKPAPVQVMWLGYFDSTGMRAVDYIIGDNFVCPPEDDELYVEKVARLPDSWFCYTPPDESPEVEPTPALSNGCVTFGCLNNIAKVTPEVVAVWAKILQALPGSRLTLKSAALGDPSACERYEGLFAEHAIAPARITYLAGSPFVEHLAAHNQIDIALDPFPYNGGATTLDALWMGVPVITLKGDRFSGRLGVSTLSVLGLQDLIAATPEEYVSKALALAEDLDRLTDMRAGLRQRLADSAICDGVGMARALENLYRQMWREWCITNAERV